MKPCFYREMLPLSFGIRAAFPRSMANDDPVKEITITNLADAGRAINTIHKDLQVHAQTVTKQFEVFRKQTKAFVTEAVQDATEELRQLILGLNINPIGDTRRTYGFAQVRGHRQEYRYREYDDRRAGGFG